MPPQFLIDIASIDLDRTLLGPEQIREVNPQRGDMEHLDGICYVNTDGGEIIGYKDVRPDEFWVAGHIPGRPLLPGVLMIEAAAQVASFYTKKFVGWEGFIGFGGVEDCKFRMQVAPGRRMYILCKQIWKRHRRILCQAQGIVDGNLAFEASIVGTQM